jgi:hypothetical protein
LSAKLQELVNEIENQGTMSTIRTIHTESGKVGHVLMAQSSQHVHDLAEAVNARSDPDLFAVREATVRSMMAEYNGHVGMFEISRPNELGGKASCSPYSALSVFVEFKYAFQSCGFVWHIFVWIVVIGDLVLFGLAALAGVVVSCCPQRLPYVLVRDKTKEA